MLILGIIILLTVTNSQTVKAADIPDGDQNFQDALKKAPKGLE